MGAVAALLLGFGAVWVVRTLTPAPEPTAAAAQATTAAAQASVGLPPVQISAGPELPEAPEPDATDAGASDQDDAGTQAKPKVSPTWKGFQKKSTEPDLGF